MYFGLNVCRLSVEVLTPGPAFKQALPVRCRLCTSRKQSVGKVFDAHNSRRRDAIYFLRQHFNTQQHQRMMQDEAGAKVSAVLQPTSGPCEGLSLRDESSGILYHMVEHFKHWLAWRGDCQELLKHTYTYVENGDNYVLRSAKCAKVCSVEQGRRTVCGQCSQLIDLKKSVVRSSLKRFSAQYLFAKLFQPTESAEQLVHEMKNDIIYARHSVQVEKILKLQLWELQQYVRSAFLSIRQDRRNNVLQSFLDGVVLPAVNVNLQKAADQKPAILQAQSALDRFLKSSDVEEVEQIRVLIAQASLSGRMENHPVLQGLTLSCLRAIEREESGSHSLQGRIKEGSAMHTAAAKSLAMEAGRLLALSGCSSRTLKLFHAPMRPWRDRNYSATLVESGLPVPFDALKDVEALRHNVEMADCKLSLATKAHGRISLLELLFQVAIFLCVLDVVF